MILCLFLTGWRVNFEYIVKRWHGRKGLHISDQLGKTRAKWKEKIRGQGKIFWHLFLYFSLNVISIQFDAYWLLLMYLLSAKVFTHINESQSKVLVSREIKKIQIQWPESIGFGKDILYFEQHRRTAFIRKLAGFTQNTICQIIAQNDYSRYRKT